MDLNLSQLSMALQPSCSRNCSGWSWLPQCSVCSEDFCGIACDVKKNSCFWLNIRFYIFYQRRAVLFLNLFCWRTVQYCIRSFPGFLAVQTSMKRVAFSATKWKLPQAAFKYRRPDAHGWSKPTSDPYIYTCSPNDLYFWIIEGQSSTTRPKFQPKQGASIGF